MRKEIEEKVKQWILLAEDDLKTVENELKSDEPVTRSICFHAQQCVEKYLKAYLTLKQRAFRKTHDIEELIFLCKNLDAEFDKLYEIKSHELNKYAIDVRYPDDIYFPTLEEAIEAKKIAVKSKEFIVEKLKKEGLRI